MDLEKYGVETHNKVLKFWKENSVYSKSRIIFKNSKNKKPFYFLQGPPYTSGKFHIAHAWNNVMKDFILRHRRMKGFEVWDRAGYDTHGLPTAKKVQKKFDLKTKEDIEKFGFEKFAEECLTLSKNYAKIMNQDLIDIGVWMDFENAYMPIDQDYIDGVWFLIKTAHEKKRLYQGLRTTTWCRDCATALAKHEQEYTELIDKSIYVKFKSKDEENTYFVIWTTTPWTITFNLAIMVHPDFEYCKVEVEFDDKKEYWVIAKELLESVMKKAKLNYKIIKTFQGKELSGKKYVHFWQDKISDLKEINSKYDEAHSILLSKEYVTLNSGTGLVHTAPGCGPEDFEVGHSNGLPPFNTINQYGIFPENYSEFSNLIAKVDDLNFVESMKKLNVLVAEEDYVHDYAICERCSSPVVFRTTKQWFFKVEDLKPKMLEFNKKINWLPMTAKNGFAAWLENLRDNSITKQRFWGTPVPIWICDTCKQVEVIGSKEELQSKTDNLPENLHKPWIDSVTWSCRKCPGIMKRLPDVLDVWIDAGTASWNSLYYPKRKDLFEKFFPANFILEAREQVRGWFNLLMISSIIAFDKNCFDNCYMHGMLTDVDGVKMSKSLGNIIRPQELTEKYGADTLRFYMPRTKPGSDINFSWDEAELAYKNLVILWNTHKLLINFSKELKLVPEKLNPSENLSISSKYILSKCNNVLKKVSHYFDNYEIDKIAPEIESLFLEISRVYIQVNRDVMALGEENEKKQIMNTLFVSIETVIKMLAPICPFISEQIYQNLKDLKAVEKDSVHLEFWPDFDEKLIDDELEKNFNIAMNIVEAGLSARDKAQLGVRWPLQNILLDVQPEIRQVAEEFSEIIKNQLNVKEISFGMPEIDLEISPNYREIGSVFGTETGDVLTAIKGKDETIVKHLKKGEDYHININDKEFILTEEMFKIKKVCKNYSIAESKFGTLYLNTITTKELETEGFVRELTRRVQNLRKKAEMQKSERIVLYIEAPEDLNIKDHEDFLKQKVGADSVKFEAKTSLKHKLQEKIKGKNFFIAIEKL